MLLAGRQVIKQGGKKTEGVLIKKKKPHTQLILWLRSSVGLHLYLAVHGSHTEDRKLQRFYNCKFNKEK